MACGHATAAPPKTLRNSRRCMSTPERAHCIRSTECIERGWPRVACCKA
jgi:hypothetical protein